MEQYWVAVTALLVSGAAAGQALETRIDSVTVYPHGANITRVAQAEFAPGTHSVNIANLPPRIDTSLVRVAVVGAGSQLGNVTFSENQVDQSEDPELARLRAQLQSVQDDLAVQTDRVQSAQLQVDFIKSLSSNTNDEGNYAGGSMAATIATIGQSSADAYAVIRNSQKIQRGLMERADRLERELKNAGSGALAYTSVTMDLSTAVAGPVTVQLTYFQPAARWRSEYEARLDSETPRLQLKQLASVSQSTTEDWLDVELTLATSRVDGRLAAPEVPAEFLELGDPRPVLGRAGAALDEVKVTGPMRFKSAPMAEPAPVVVERQNYAAQYRIPGRVTVRNNRPDKRGFEIYEVAATPSLITRAVPRYSRDAFLTARFEYGGDVPLAGGKMALFVDGSFAGSLASPTINPGQQVTLPMGLDLLVQVSQINQGSESGQGGLVRRRQEESTNLLFTVINRRQATTEVEVIDRIPRSENREIKVSVPDDATPPTERDVDDQPGVIAWRRALDGGETWKILHRYEISYPADKRLMQRQSR